MDVCLHLPFNRVNHLFQGASPILIVATLQDADFAEIRTFFYDSKCRSISFFLLSFLASKVEAISCIIMSVIYRQKWEHLSEMKLPPKNLGEKKKNEMTEKEN